MDEDDLRLLSVSWSQICISMIVEGVEPTDLGPVNYSQSRTSRNTLIMCIILTGESSVLFNSAEKSEAQ